MQVGDSAVAVVADTWWHAKTALDALPIVWDEGPNAKVSSATIADMLKAGLDADQAFVGNQNGDAKAAIAGAAKKVEAVYAYPFQNHAPMEPMNATARYTPDRCEVWVPTQNGEAAFAATLAASGLPADKCDVYKINLGGGFGRRGAFHDYVTQAVLIAKQMPGTPVKLIWSREEDMTHGRYHPVTQCKLVGGFDANSNLTGLHMRISGQSILAAVRPEALQDGARPGHVPGRSTRAGEPAFGYTVPNLLIDHAMRNPHVPPGFWRGVNINQNAIYIECFMDELAQAGGPGSARVPAQADGKHPKHLAVLNAVAERGGWGKPAPQGVYRGLAQMMAFGSYVAACAEVSVSGGDKVKIHRIVGATDPGYAVNPAQIERQVAGSFVYGLSALFMAGVHGQGRRASSRRTSTPTTRCASRRCRRSSRSSCRRGGFWGGVGEPTICVAAPAVLNAFFARDRQAHPHVPAEEPRPHRWCRRCSRALAAAIGLASIAARRGGVAGAAGRRRSCSGCHPASARGVVAGAAPRRADRAAIAKAMQDFRRGSGPRPSWTASPRASPTRRSRRSPPGTRRSGEGGPPHVPEARCRGHGAPPPCFPCSILRAGRPPRASWSSAAASPARAARARSRRPTRASPSRWSSRAPRSPPARSATR